MESKRKNVYITIFVITTIIAAGLAIFFKVDSDNKLKSMEAKVEESSKEVISQFHKNCLATISTKSRKLKKSIFFYSKPRNKFEIQSQVQYERKLMILFLIAIFHCFQQIIELENQLLPKEPDLCGFLQGGRIRAAWNESESIRKQSEEIRADCGNGGHCRPAGIP